MVLIQGLALIDVYVRPRPLALVLFAPLTHERYLSHPVTQVYHKILLNENELTWSLWLAKFYNIPLNDIGDQFWTKNIRYHCPVYRMLKLNKHITSIYTRHIWLYDRGDYESFPRDLNDIDWNSITNNDIDEYANYITECITKLAKNIYQRKILKYVNQILLG